MNKTDSLIIYRKQGGGIGVLIPSEKTKLTLEQIQQKDVEDGAESRIIYRADVPEELTFRDAWDASFENYEGVFIDMEKARYIAQNKIRRYRKPVLETLDVEYMKASEFQDSATMAEVAAKKQVLRDLPASPAIQEATTPEELKRLAETSVQEAVAKSKDNKLVG